MQQNQRAEAFRALHRPGDPVILPNVWDAAGARLMASLGFPAIASSSAAVAFLEGYPDGEMIGRELALEGIKRIADAVDLPVTADLERGYGPTVADAVATARGAIAAGAIGMNFEDASDTPGALVDADFHAERVAAIRAAGVEAGVNIVINARTDVYLEEVGDPAGRRDEAIRRCKLYRAAGAGCVFVPGLNHAETIGAIARAVDAPLNILANASTPSLAELRALGIARISLGSAPYRLAMTALRDIALAARDAGSFALCGGIITHAEMQALMQ